MQPPPDHFASSAAGAASPAASAVPQPGEVLLGKYRVERVIGVGGMGAVVAARHLQLEEQVAIKFLLPQMLAHAEIVQRFLREARSAIKIRSEHCVRVLDVGTLESGAPYMVMEFLQGQDLSTLVDPRRPLAIPDAIDWVLQAGEALAEAHLLGIVHRDLKPANLFLTRRADGTPCVKVLDFGISKQTASGADAGVTKTQAVLGSPRYMSPEQMRSTRDVDARADVWALGAVIHELVAGEPPFDAETMTALCAAILQDPPRAIRATRPDVPPQLEAAIRGALEKDRDRRFQNIAQLAAALAPFGSSSARASAERIARVLGVPAAAPQPTAMLDPRTSNPALARPSPMSATTGGSGSITSDVTRRSSSGVLVAVGVGAFLLLAVGGGVGLVAWKRHATGEGAAAAASAPPATGAPVVTPPAAPPSAVGLVDPSATPSASAPAAAASSSASPASAAQSAAAPGVPTPSRPGIAPRRPPGAGGQPPAGAPGPTKQQQPPSNNPFGDDRRG